jgi:hypothetical protein
MLNVTVGPSQRHQSLTIYPLLAEDAPNLPYSLMSEALREGTLRITEIGSGSVPELLAVNTGDTVILVLDGEQLVGAKQNRTTNRSLLLPPKSETRIPVSCMEQGRWRFDSDSFLTTPSSSPTVVRRQARDVEAERVRHGREVPTSALAAAQGDVWNAIASHSSKLGTHSGTGALNDLYQTREADLIGWAAEYRVGSGQVGVLAFLGGRPLGMDLVGCTRLYADLHERLVRGYVMDALGASDAHGEVPAGAAQRFLDQVSSARRVESPTVGMGRYAILSDQVVGGELREHEPVVHLSAFPSDDRPARGPQPARYDDPIAPPSRRRPRSI